MPSPSTRSLQAAMRDVRAAVREFDAVGQWLAQLASTPAEPLAAEVWVFDEALTHVLLVKHQWREWVPPGGRVEPDEAPRAGAARELLEETGIGPTLHPRPAVAALRSYGPGYSPTLGLSYAAIADRSHPVVPEPGQPVAWMPLDQEWRSCFPDDRQRMLWHAEWLRRTGVTL